ncbi:uncharacterized protein YndB with AHSA1/START domain [Actinoplanes octamycinicus]|uniref:Uncharacterized protein YndB with AHSA1/START domain n=1 Tax=Actinoplanes octamycinicus TaxID=135948 RepID=A0A7W7M8T1_9ACTN|nr:SRPBCC domain-containing protein [Actinoplanes octamycinicus]MBB4741135.1 uncharacterized protein YndB with AHSA1/START domain [Actinoplanes octamycinicus]GIE56042.1 activator of HSP90 ATPase [Actinoplanes octamycinicus]
MELGTIEREIYIDATPEVVFDVVSSPEHVKGWWPDDADYDPVPGGAGTIRFGDCAAGGKVEQFSVVDAIPPKLFAFRWTHELGEPATEGNSLLVTFELTPSGSGTLLRMTETGFRERGWSQAVLEQCYREHVTGWDHFLPRIAPYAATLRGRA